MKRMLLSLSFMAALLVAVQVKADFICWDGSFAYNAAGFFEKHNRFELTFQGRNVGTLNFEFLDQLIAVSGPAYGSKIHVAFTKDECVQDSHTQTWACETVAHSIEPNVFVEYGVDDLTRSIPVISATQVDRITVVIKKGEKLALTFYDRPQGQEPRVQRVDLDIPMCDRLAWGGMDGTRFPKRLVDFFDVK